jgi:hypothetical protein
VALLTSLLAMFRESSIIGTMEWPRWLAIFRDSSIIGTMEWLKHKVCHVRNRTLTKIE